MKKIVGILGMAAMLGSAAFAAEPAANYVMAEFTGNAGFGVKADFVEDDAKFGMYNDATAGIKFGFVTAGDKATTGDGVWGELAIKVEANDASNEFPKTIAKAPTVETAKIHLVNGDFTAALNILKPGLSIAAVEAPKATNLTVATKGKDVKGDLTNGFAIELGLADVFAFNFKFMDKGLQTAKNQKFGLAFDASLLAVENLSAKAGAAFNFETKDMLFGVDAGYNFKIDDKLYVKPGVAFDMYKADKVEAVNSLEAGVLFGWGAVEQEPGFKWVSDKTAEGVSVGYGTDLKNTNTIVVGLYDQSLMSLLGDDFGTLKSGAAFKMDMVKGADDKVTNTMMVAFGARYSIDIDPVYFNLGADVKMDKAGDAEAKTAYLINARIGSKKVIDNTDLYVEYNVGDTTAAKKIDTHNLTIGTAISF